MRDIIVFCDTQGREHGALSREEAIEKLERVATFPEKVSMLNFEFSSLLVVHEDVEALAEFLKQDNTKNRRIYIDQRTFRVWYRDESGRGYLLRGEQE